MGREGKRWGEEKAGGGNGQGNLRATEITEQRSEGEKRGRCRGHGEQGGLEIEGLGGAEKEDERGGRRVAGQGDGGAEVRQGRDAWGRGGGEGTGE